MKQMLTQTGFGDEKKELLKIKSEWRSLYNNEIFQDFVFLREASQTRLATEKIEKERRNRKDSILLPFLKQQQQKRMEQARKFTLIGSLAQLSDFTPSVTFINKNNFEEIYSILSTLVKSVLIQQLQTLMPDLEKLVNACKQCGIVGFYFMAIYFQTQIQYVYCRRKEGYNIWKRFLRTCNLQGKRLQKYKLLAYRQLARCALDLGDLDKEAIYLKKLLKLSWVVKDRNYELLCYDMIAINYYYRGDVNRAQFFHSKFVSGEFEAAESNIRIAGVSSYLNTQKLKAQVNDQDSFSLDDMDLDIIIQKDNILKWQKGLPVFDSRHITQHRVLINQWSCNRDLTVHLINREKQKHKTEEEDIGFVPLNQNIKRLLKLFQFDVKYFIQNGYLYDFQ
ncbi:unnamed protein product [Paramecium octaurelia]|uniref:Uncharacterized protein n=1 Tax=Paramecium octaurelia TaxID=43137 RepID=A0A8S1SA81_PAROT|nr:unnamed protein product [Paramecium octaurelia]